MISIKVNQSASDGITMGKAFAIFREIDDIYLRELAADIKDIKERLLYALKGKNPNPFADMTEPAIVVAMELAPSDTIKMNSDLVLEFATQLGGVNR